MHLGDEAVSLSRNGLDVTRLGLLLLQNLPNLPNSLLDRIDLLLAAPHFAQKFRLGHHAVAVLDEKLKRGQGLGGKPDRLLAALERAQLVVELKSAEAHNRVVCPAGIRWHVLFRPRQELRLMSIGPMLGSWQGKSKQKLQT